jgi:hypothetical protein
MSASVGRVVIRWFAALVFLAAAQAGQPAMAGGGNVLPPTAKSHGYSLTDLAALTGEFNVGPRDGVPPTVGTPFVMLYVPSGDETAVFHVEPGTMLYVPVVNSYGDPVDVTDKAALADLYFSPFDGVVVN